MTWLTNPVATIAFLWRIERRDGVTLGFTSHDRDLVSGGLLHRAAPGMAPAAVSARDDLDAEGGEVSGALSGAAIREEDLRAGRWDGAAVTLHACDWTSPDETLLLSRGGIGTVETRDGRFTAEMSGMTAVLEAAVVEQTSPECRAELGDRRCRVAVRRRRATVTAVDDDEVIEVSVAEPVADAWGWGRLRWLDGANAGLTSAVHSSAGTRVRLMEAPAFAVEIGTAIELIEGCDKRLETCAGRFANAVNFRGEPHLPGMDLLTRYPGG